MERLPLVTMQDAPPDAQTKIRGPHTLVPDAIELDTPENPSRTIRRAPAGEGSETSHALARLAEHAGNLAHELEIEGVIGLGGMGVVHRARQRALDRVVAVKSVRPDAPQRSGTRMLLQEAWAAAALEHPNVVPVYDLLVDEERRPRVVLRKIEGRTWTELIADPERVRSTFGVRDLLAWHLGVLMSVCNAVHYAHSRGILHRDLKPDNVMVGAFGEVYVLDWGLAVRFSGGDDGRLPLSHEERLVVGTPRFMAPEMARGEGRALGPHSDVYLLGAMLYMVLTGEAPHPGEEVKATLAAIPHFQPRLPPSTPPRLAQLVTRALAADPAARPASAEVLRQEVQAWLEERNVDALVEEAVGRLSEMRRVLDAPEINRQKLYHSFGAARFGFQAALRAGPDHTLAAGGLAEAVSTMARYELAQGDPRAAAILIDELVDPPEDLVAKRAAVLAADDARAARAAIAQKDQDPTIGQRTRIFVMSVASLFWSGILLTLWWRAETITYSQLRNGHILVVAACAGLVWWARDSLGRTALNRQVAALLVGVPTVVLFRMLAAPMMGLSLVQGFTIDLLFFSAICGLAAIAVHRASVVPALAYLLAYALVVHQPSWVYGLTAICHSILGVATFVAWAPDARGRLWRRTPEEKAALQKD